MKNSCAQYIATLTIAGSDSSGGAGIQADIKTMSALGCYAASAITAITVQNTLGVTAVHAVPPEIVAGQIKAVMDDIEPRTVKIGMVNDAATIHAIASTLKAYEVEHLVVDPVMVATSGSRLMQDDAVEVFCRELLPLATLLTPNVPEAEVLSGVKITDKASMDEAARRVSHLGCSNLLIKGGHLAGQKVDRLYGDVEREYVAENVETRNTHGTGCTLSSAITSYLAQGFATDEAIGKAKEWLTEALKAGANVEIGKGHGPVNHFFNPKRTIILTPDS
ncbi:MAG: bifunctional hydroxymethylpyrimidine kinase/phosphomethylpyrimidine kinase [Prevotella sp.]